MANKPKQENLQNKPSEFRRDSTSNLSMAANNNIMGTLECPVCSELMQSPIFICEGGHNVCKICRIKNPTAICPTCRGRMSMIRNYALECIIDEVSVKCHNKSYGCTYISTIQKLDSHNKHCLFHQHSCIVGLITKKCSWQGNRTDILRHTRRSHSENSLLRAGRQILFENFSVTEFQQDLQIINIRNDLFIYHVKIDPKINIAYWAIQYVADKSLEVTWKYEFTFYKSDEPVKRINVVEICHSDAESVSELFESGKCVGIPLNVLSNYIHPNKSFSFKFFIFK